MTIQTDAKAGPGAAAGGFVPSDGFLVAVGQAVLLQRRARGLYRAELAARAHVSTRYLADVEKGRANISLRRLKDLADALETTVDALLPGGSHRARSPRVSEDRLEHWRNPKAVADLFAYADEASQRTILELLLATSRKATVRSGTKRGG